MKNGASRWFLGQDGCCDVLMRGICRGGAEFSATTIEINRDGHADHGT
jgi:hypothetical protein